MSRNLEIRRRTVGPEDRRTVDTIASLASVYTDLGKYPQAEVLQSQALEIRRRIQGPEHPYACVHAQPCRRIQALDFYQKELPDDWQRFRAETLLAAAWAGEKKFAEAEPLLLEGYQGMAERKDRIAVPDRYHLERAREWLMQLYLDWGKPGKAVEWRTKAAGRSGQPSSRPLLPGRLGQIDVLG